MFSRLATAVWNELKFSDIAAQSVEVLKQQESAEFAQKFSQASERRFYVEPAALHFEKRYGRYGEGKDQRCFGIVAVKKVVTLPDVLRDGADCNHQQ